MTRAPVAIAHDYLTQRGGAERVVLALSRAFPDAPIYTTFYEPDATYPEFRELDIRTSWLDRFGPLRRDPRRALPILPIVSRSMSVDADLTIASSSGWAHGFRHTGRSLVYCHTPARWLYESGSYLGADASRSTRLALSTLSPWLKAWDQQAASHADVYLANSTVIVDRIRRAYAKNAKCVPPPHGINGQAATPSARIPEPGYFLVVSRLLPYKNVDAVIEAFRRMPDLRLFVVGAGPERERLVSSAPSTVTFAEGLTDGEMAAAYDGSVGVVAASYEDFGLVPLEAAARGRPVAALHAGGFIDTVVEDQTGIFFREAAVDEIVAAIRKLAGRHWDVDVLTARARGFDEEHFATQIRAAVSHMTESSDF